MAIRSFLAIRIQTRRNRHKDVSGRDERADLMEQLVGRRSEGIMSSNNLNIMQGPTYYPVV
jgi:hypothetical protein